MKSLILTVLYLARDTAHRWVTRPSSPVARVLVVFFLSLCALCFLGSYVISAKVIRERILSQGGDLVHVMTSPHQGNSLAMPTEKEIDALLGADSLGIEVIGSVMAANKKYYHAATYDFSRVGQFLPLMANGGAPTLFVSREEGLPEGLTTVSLAHRLLDVQVRYLPPDHLLMRMTGDGCLVVTPEQAGRMMNRSFRSGNGAAQVVLRIRDISRGSAALKKVEDYMKTYIRLNGDRGNVASASRLIEQMDIILGNQAQGRAAFCLGIACIVGILLTALAGMEYRQNEYIYTLMKSFGIHPLLLVGAFVVENFLLVGSSFALAVAVFMRTQKVIVAQFFKMGKFELTLAEIAPEIHLIALSLAACVLVSSLPICLAANRQIGRVLK